MGKAVKAKQVSEMARAEFDLATLVVEGAPLAMSEFRSWAQAGGVTSAALSWALHSVLRGLPDEPVRMLREELARRGAVGTCPPMPQLDDEPFSAHVRDYLTRHRLLEVLERAFNQNHFQRFNA